MHSGRPAETFFNFGTGSQTVRFTREVFLPHLLVGNGRHTKYLVFGVSPDWLLTTPKSLRLINLYKESLHYRMTNPDPGEDDRIGTAISHFLARHLALYRYRSDLIHQELIPDLRCWLLGDCYVRPYIDAFMTFREAERVAGLQTRYGWHSDLWALLTSGEYKSHGGQARFTEENEVDRENLKGLIDKVRKADITPVFLMATGSLAWLFVIPVMGWPILMESGSSVPLSSRSRGQTPSLAYLINAFVTDRDRNLGSLVLLKLVNAGGKLIPLAPLFRE